MSKYRPRGTKPDSIRRLTYELPASAVTQLDLLAVHSGKTRRTILAELIDEAYNKHSAEIERKLTTLRR